MKVTYFQKDVETIPLQRVDQAMLKTIHLKMQTPDEFMVRTILLRTLKIISGQKSIINKPSATNAMFNAKGISKEHAYLWHVRDVVYLQKCKPKCKVVLNGKSFHRQSVVHTGDMISFGKEKQVEFLVSFLSNLDVSFLPNIKLISNTETASNFDTKLIQFDSSLSIELGRETEHYIPTTSNGIFPDTISIRYVCKTCHVAVR